MLSRAVPREYRDGPPEPDPADVVDCGANEARKADGLVDMMLCGRWVVEVYDRGMGDRKSDECSVVLTAEEGSGNGLFTRP